MKSIVKYLLESTGDPTLVWIDDIRNPQDDKWKSFIHKTFPGKEIKHIVWVKSYKEFVQYLQDYGCPDYICFDHDLGDVSNTDNEKTGYDCCKYLVDICMNTNTKFPKYAIQSDNGPGSENIDKYIQNYKKHCE